MNIHELEKSLRNKMFGDRPTLDEAYEFAQMIARGTDSPMHVMTAVQVVVNTICNQLKELDEYVQNAEQ